jgi:hypothetical protein
MDEKKIRTDYSKVSLKTTPTSIRFNVKDLEVAFKMSGKETKQTLVDFLLSNYVGGGNPITSRMVGQKEEKSDKKENEGEKKQEKSQMPDPKDKAAYLKWLRNN